MVLKKEEATDKKYKRKATLEVKGKKMEMNVYGDTEHPNRRTVIGPDVEGNLPKRAEVDWMGKDYTAERTFRYRKGGGSVPAYQWFVE